MKKRCGWAGDDPLYIGYHDLEWGVPEHDERKLFEMLILEGAQAGLSWRTILGKREAYRKSFSGFDPVKVARYGPPRIERLLLDAGIVRNRAKVVSAVGNARAFLAIQKEFGSFDVFLWRFVDGRPRINRWRDGAGVPAETPESTALSRELRRRGMRFVGPTLCYAFMQAVGLVNDHVLDCFRHRELGGQGGRAR